MWSRIKEELSCKGRGIISRIGKGVISYPCASVQGSLWNSHSFLSLVANCKLPVSNFDLLWNWLRDWVFSLFVCVHLCAYMHLCMCACTHIQYIIRFLKCFCFKRFTYEQIFRFGKIGNKEALVLDNTHCPNGL